MAENVALPRHGEERNGEARTGFIQVLLFGCGFDFLDLSCFNFSL
jgi:hypothetical protein